MPPRSTLQRRQADHRQERRTYFRRLLAEQLEDRALLASDSFLTDEQLRLVQDAVLLRDASGLSPELHQYFRPDGSLGDIPLAPGQAIFLGPAADAWSPDEPTNLNAAKMIGANQLWPGGSTDLHLSGQSIHIGLWEAGGYPLTTHPDLVSLINLADDNPAHPVSSHATHIAGTINASGDTDVRAHGLANFSHITAYDSLADISELDSAASAIHISNHSYAAATGWIHVQPGDSSFPELTWGRDVWAENRSLHATRPGRARSGNRAGRTRAFAADLRLRQYAHPRAE